MKLTIPKKTLSDSPEKPQIVDELANALKRLEDAERDLQEAVELFKLHEGFGEPPEYWQNQVTEARSELERIKREKCKRHAP